MERIPTESWDEHKGHIKRYQYAASRIPKDSVVNDIACGIGYGSEILSSAKYRGYDLPGIPNSEIFNGEFIGVDLNDDEWIPKRADFTICFETLEHVLYPKILAEKIGNSTSIAIFVSVPIVPTMHLNPHHFSDFSKEEIPPMFKGFYVEDEWEQPEEFSHVWELRRSAT